MLLFIYYQNFPACKITKKSVCSNLFILPFCFFQINEAESQHQYIINDFGSKANIYRCLKNHAYSYHIEGIEHLHAYFKHQGILRVSRTGYAIEIHIGQ